MDLKGKKLLILCGNAIHCKVVEAAKEMNVYTIVTDSLPLEDAPAKQMADEALFLDVRDVDAIVDYCREHCVDGVLNFCNDLAQRPQHKICEALGLPCFGTEKQYHLLTDKIRADEIFEYLIRKKMLIRDASSFTFLDESYLRFCILRQEDNAALIQELYTLIEKA